MDKLKRYKKLEENKNKKKKDTVIYSHLLVQFGVLLVLIVIFQIIYIISINSVLKEKRDQLLQVNYKKYLLDEGNKQLYNELNEGVLTRYSYDEEIKEKDRNIKIKDEEIINFKKKSSYLLNNFSPTIETLIKSEEINKKKETKVNKLHSLLKNSKKVFDSKIIDSIEEINSIESLINENNIKNYKLCYRGENKEIDYSKVYEKCDFDREIPFLIIFQTDIYERFGIYISNNKIKNSIIFSFNFSNPKENMKVEINDNQKKSFIYLINLIKDMKFNDEKKENEKEKENKDDMKKINISDLEVFYM